MIAAGQRTNWATGRARELLDAEKDLATVAFDLMTENRAQCVPPLSLREVVRIVAAVSLAAEVDAR